MCPLWTHQYNIGEFLELGVTRTPAVIVDGEIILSGKVPTVAELKILLAKKQG